jgi:hypothetical protein
MQVKNEWERIGSTADCRGAGALGSSPDDRDLKFGEDDGDGPSIPSESGEIILFRVGKLSDRRAP